MPTSVTGLQLAAGRALAGLTRKELAERGEVIRHWESSSADTVRAYADNLHRAISAIEGAGVTFTAEGGVSPAPASTSHHPAIGGCHT